MPRVNVKDQRKQQLIDANLQCIAKLGLEQTTIADVSKAAGMSRGIVNFYFESKDRMMLETLKMLIDEYETQLDKICGNAATADTFIAAHSQGKLVTQKFLTGWFAFIGQAATQKDYRKLVAACEQRTLARLKDAVEAGQAKRLLAFIQGAWISVLLSNHGFSKDELAASCHALLDSKASVKAADVVEFAAHKPTPKKKPTDEPTAPQLDFGDLFSSLGR